MDVFAKVGPRVALREEQLYITQPGSTTAVITQGSKPAVLTKVGESTGREQSYSHRIKVQVNLCHISEF